MSRIYRPRMAAELSVPIAGSRTQRIAMSADDSVVALPVRVNKAVLKRNDHGHADALDLSAEWNDAGIDPRMLASAAVRFWLGNAKDGGTWQPTDADLRFAGVLISAARSASEDAGMNVTLSFLDYTTLFLEAKHYPASGLPDMAMTLSQAWQRICDNTGMLNADGQIVSTVSVLRDRLVFRGDAHDVEIGQAVAPRFRKLARVQTPGDVDSWAVWQQCVRMLGLISFIDVDRCVVTTATDYYSAKRPAVLVWGQNLASLSEQRDTHFAQRGIAVRSFDPLTGRTLEALWPPQGDSRATRKRVVA